MNGGIDLIIDFLKHYSVYGISLWFIVRTSIFLAVFLWPIYNVALRLLTGGSDE